jgi:signal transduction histidine kinase
MAARDAARGMPIAAHLGLLVALAFISAFVGVFAVVIWLPPRPPDVMRADMVADHFQAGYRYMVADGHTLPNDNMSWDVSDAPPKEDLHEPAIELTRAQLLETLKLRPEQVRLSASTIDRRNDMWVIQTDNNAERHVMVHGEHIIIRTPMPGMPVAAPDDVEAPEAPAPPEVSERVEVTETPEGHEHVEVHARREAPEPPPPAPPPRAAPAPHAAPTPPAIPPTPPLWIPTPHGVALISGFELAAQLPDGRWLTMRQGRNWAELNWLIRAGSIIGGALAVLAILALLFARQLARPIQHFSDAVQAVGVNPQSASVTEEGPSELRGAARAVNTMQARLRALVADRTKTLAAVAHDMRTPLMRLRLAAENAPPEQRDKMAKEIGEVEALVASFIAFARDDPAEEARVRLDVSALLQSLADDHAAAGRKVSFSGDERVVITGQSLGLKRLFGNLIDNALKHGGDAHISLRRDDGAVTIDIQDDGPGVPMDQRDSVFEPFVRLNDGASGAGLGLAAARSIARAHGGDVVIADSARGALLRVTLPA